jgi:cell division protein FtsZ
MDPDSIEAWAGRRAGSSFAVVGLGGAGAEAVVDLIGLGSPGVRTYAINTDARHLKMMPADERILIGERQLRGRGSGGNRSAVVEAAADGCDTVIQQLSKFEMVFLLAGLGGGTGSALLPYLASRLRKTDALPIPVAFLPFQLEIDTNVDRRENVHQALSELEEMGGLLLAMSNEKLRRFEALPLSRVFRVRNAYVHALVTSLVDMVEHPSQLNVDLASLKTHLASSGLSTLLCSEHHISEPERLVHAAMTEGLLDFTLADRPSALIHLDGGSNMTLRTLDRVIRSVRQRLGEPQQLLFGTRIRPEPREVVRLTAVVGGLKARTFRDAVEPTPDLSLVAP